MAFEQGVCGATAAADATRYRLAIGALKRGTCRLPRSSKRAGTRPAQPRARILIQSGDKRPAA